MSLSWTMINILLVIYAITFDVPELLGTLWTVIGLSRFLTETPSGILVDKVGSKPVIVGGLAVIGASYLLFASAQTPTEVLVSSALAGAGFVFSAIGLMVQAAYYTPPDERVRYMGILNGSTMASNIVGPTIGGFIADCFGLRISFIASSMTVFIALLIALMTREIEAKGSGRTVRGMLHDYRIFMKKRLYLDSASHLWNGCPRPKHHSDRFTLKCDLNHSLSGTVLPLWHYGTIQQKASSGPWAVDM
jgi:MFS family permease